MFTIGWGGMRLVLLCSCPFLRYTRIVELGIETPTPFLLVFRIQECLISDQKIFPFRTSHKRVQNKTHRYIFLAEVIHVN
jgi:hypothetical protein